MAKIILESNEISVSESPIVIDAPKYHRDEEVVVSLGPSKEEIESGIEKMKREFQVYKTSVEESFEQWKLEEIRKSENEAFDIVKKAAETISTKLSDADVKCSIRLKEAEREAAKIKNKALEETETIQFQADKDGYIKGKMEGIQAGNQWVRDSIKKLNTILSTVARERTQLIDDVKDQISQLVVVMGRKFVSTIVESQSRVAYDNIMGVLKNLKGRAEIVIRVNSEDLSQTSKHKREFLQAIEGIERIKITEDNMVDKGGCIIETEYGVIDSKVSTQLSKVEKLINDILSGKNVSDDQIIL